MYVWSLGRFLAIAFVHVLADTMCCGQALLPSCWTWQFVQTTDFGMHNVVRLACLIEGSMHTQHLGMAVSPPPLLGGEEDVLGHQPSPWPL
jgi:hypothetical protein